MVKKLDLGHKESRCMQLYHPTSSRFGSHYVSWLLNEYRENAGILWNLLAPFHQSLFTRIERVHISTEELTRMASKTDSKASRNARGT